MDGLCSGSADAKNLLFVLCATNCPWEIDAAMLRRFQKRIFIGLPNTETRAEILKLKLAHSEGGSVSDDELRQLAEQTEGSVMILNRIKSQLR